MSTNKKISWVLAQTRQEGRGNWEAFPKEDLEKVYIAAKEWKKILAKVDKPWLCWCMDDDLCSIQQQLVKSVGWTPIVGTDGRFSKPTLHKRSIFIDFNKHFNYPIMTMQFPLEFAFLFVNKLAFWHSDLFPPVSIMKKIAFKFNRIKDGEYMGIKIPLRYTKRWFEVLGCTTKDASKSQFKYGCGIWRCIKSHPNISKKIIDADPYYDHGVGVSFWEDYFNGNVKEIGIDINPYHYSITSKEGYIRTWKKNGYIDKSKYDELKINFNFDEIFKNLELK